jgi:hypothetical protein
MRVDRIIAISTRLRKRYRGLFRGTGVGRKQRFLRYRSMQLPYTECRKKHDSCAGENNCQEGRPDPASATPARHYNEPLSGHFGSPWNASMTSKILIVVFLIAIVWNLGAGMYYMMTDKGDSDRTLKALTKRIALSVLLIVLIIIGMLTGYIQPHGL